MRRLFAPTPPPVAGESRREEAAFDWVATIYNETSDGYVAVEGHRNLACHVDPVDAVREVPPWETTRRYTDEVVLRGYYPRLNSGYEVEVTGPDGESIFMTIKDVEFSGDRKFTTLLARRKGIDRA